MSAKNFINATCNKKVNSLEEVKFQVFSQLGEDGIIQWLFHNVKIKEKIFIEFGVEDYTEANTRFLLKNNNWTDLAMDGSPENIDHLKKWGLMRKYDLQAIDVFIAKDNNNQVSKQALVRIVIGPIASDIHKRKRTFGIYKRNGSP